MTLSMSQALWLECPVPARGKKGLLGCRSAYLYFFPQPDVTIWGCFQCHGRRAGERLELGNDLWRPLWGEKNTPQGDQGNRSLSLSLSRAPSSHLERVSMSLLHMWPPRCGLQEEGAWDRPGLPALLACFSWGPWSRGKDPDTSSRSGPAQGDLQDSEEELVLTAVYPNGDCEDPGKGSKPCDRIASAPTEPARDLR
uniref:C2orf72-like C-terminal domain-containing protein n=1 Tax=Capra hircus TaxID=9925 RepID=A0A8C2QRR4_CAPHI